MSTKNLLYLFFCFFKKSDALYLIPTNWLLLIVIDKFTIIEFVPFSLVTKGALITFSKICLCVKSRSFILSLIPCCPLSFKTDCTIPFDICGFHCNLFCRLKKCSEIIFKFHKTAPVLECLF